MLFRTFIAIFLTLVLYLPPTQASDVEESKDKKEILIISSYHSDSKFIYDNIDAFVDEYNLLGGSLSPVVENMNCTSLTFAKSWLQTMKNILEKHNDPELIILLGAEAWLSYFSMEDEKYKKIPVFCAMSHRYGVDISNISDGEIKKFDFLEKMKDFNVKACFTYDYHVDKEIALIKDFYPDVQNIALMSDNSYNGASHLVLVQEKMKEYPELNFITIDGRKESIDSALKIVHELPENTVMLLANWRMDRNDIIYMNNAVYAMTSANPKLPVFSLTSTGIGYWAIGGYVPVYKSVGKDLGYKAYQLLDAHVDEEPYLEISKGEYRFDFEVLKKLKFENKKLPDGSILVNKQIPFYVQYRWQITATALIIIILAIGFITTYYFYIRGRILMKDLENSEHRLRMEKESLERSEHELRIAKEKAEEASKMKSTFVSNMSHEIRTPLNAIIGFSNVLASRVEDDEEQKEYVNIIYKNSDLLLQLIDDILDLSHMESGKTQFSFEKYDIVPYLDTVVKTVIQSRKPTVKIHYTPKIAEFYIETDIIRLQQIVINLLTNAIKFTSSGYIDLSFDIDEKNNLVLFSVTDTGCGIPEEKQQHIFERFEKLNKFAQGTGLGLSICKLTVERLGGEIWVDNTYKNGAKFVFTHPIYHQ